MTSTAARTSRTVVVPALNEADNLAALLPALVATGHRVVVVDGGSVDDTVLVAERAGVEVVERPRASRAEAVAAGTSVASGTVVVIDADTAPADADRAVTAGPSPVGPLACVGRQVGRLFAPVLSSVLSLRSAA